jgi:hypothetical protein
MTEYHRKSLEVMRKYHEQIRLLCLAEGAAVVGL